MAELIQGDELRLAQAVYDVWCAHGGPACTERNDDCGGCGLWHILALYPEEILAAVVARRRGEGGAQVRVFENELGNRIRITIEGPYSTIESELTPIEAGHLGEMLRGEKL